MQNYVRFLAATLGVAAAIATSTLTVRAQTPAPITKTATATKTATIVAIDYTQRVVTLQFADKSTQTVAVDPAITRFPQLKVGDQVTFTETDSLVYSIAKPGAAPPPDAATMTTASGAKPGGTATKTQTSIVTITAIDASVPTVTVQTADGRVLAFKVQDPKSLTGVKVGDKVQITYTQSLMISVK
jgi:ribosomal protein S17